MTDPTPDKETLLSPAEIQKATDITGRILEQMDRVLLGRHELHRRVVIALLCRGHVLLEGMPGLGKTALIKGLGQILDLEFKRVQFTPDLMPSDILGGHILQQDESGSREMAFRPGPVFTNILLADEINRASPKTQAALLEAMQEASVTLLGTTRQLPDPFFVLASQNPIDLEGTYPLPEAQLDRFLFKLNLEGLDADTMSAIICGRRGGQAPPVEWRANRDDLALLFAAMSRIFLPKKVGHYMARLVAASRPEVSAAPEEIRRYVAFGASPRAAIAMAEAARAHALMQGRPTVGFEDVKQVAEPVLNHRLILNYQAKMDRVPASRLIQDLLQRVEETDLNLPAEISVSHVGGGEA